MAVVYAARLPAVLSSPKGDGMRVWAVAYENHTPEGATARCLGCGETREVGRTEQWEHSCQLDEQGRLL